MPGTHCGPRAEGIILSGEDVETRVSFRNQDDGAKRSPTSGLIGDKTEHQSSRSSWSVRIISIVGWYPGLLGATQKLAAG